MASLSWYALFFYLLLIRAALWLGAWRGARFAAFERKGAANGEGISLPP